MEAFVFVEGQRHRRPMMPYEAEEFGWHQGVTFNKIMNLRDTTPLKIKEWCKQTYDAHTYAVFLRGVWFLYEHDAMLCKLRWT